MRRLGLVITSVPPGAQLICSTNESGGAEWCRAELDRWTAKYPLSEYQEAVVVEVVDA